MTTLSQDELFQILLFLPISDVCRYSQINFAARDRILSDQHLWTLLLKRDFACIMEQWAPKRGLKSLGITSMMSQSCCEEMKDYVCNVRFYQFPFDRVEVTSMNDHSRNSTKTKILFVVQNSIMNHTVMDALKSQQLVIPQDGEPFNQLGIDFRVLCMASRQPKVTPNLTFQWWTIGQGSECFQDYTSRLYYREAQSLVITVDTRHAWNDDSYSTSYSRSTYDSNSLSRALVALKESQPQLNIVPPKACQGVLIVGVGVWSEEAPISKQRFLEDCAEVFDVLPLEYFELTCQNASLMSDIILRHLYTFHQQAVLEDPQPNTTAPKSRCILN